MDADITIEALQRALLRTESLAKVGTWTWELASDVLILSPEVYRQLSLDPEHHPNPTIDLVLSRLVPGDARFLREQIARVRAGGTFPLVEVRVPLAGGDVRTIRGSGELAHRPEGDVMYGFAQDVTDSVVADEARRALEAQLHHASKMQAIGRLAGGISHDFHNLLSVILSSATFVRESVGSDAPYVRDIDAIIYASERAEGLVNQLLTFSKVQAFATTSVDLNALLRGLVILLERLLGDGIECRLRLADGLPAVSADATRLEQVVVNLAVNARDAMLDGGTLTFETSHLVDAPGGPHVLLTVVDTGTGMDEATKSQAFEPFFTTRSHGTGLGLATVFGIVTQGGGEIDLRSAPGQGTEFRIRLPVAELQPSVDTIEDALDASVRHDGWRVLVVDAQENVRAIAARILREGGFDVLEVDCPACALDICERFHEPIDLLVSDVELPGLSGRALAAAFTRRRPETGVLLMTGPGDDEARSDDFAVVHKPITPARLLAAVRAVLAVPERRPV